MAAILKRDVKMKIRLCQKSMTIYMKKTPMKFHPDPIWNDGPLGRFWILTRSPQQEQEQQDK